MIIAQQLSSKHLDTEARGQLGIAVVFRTQESQSIPMVLASVTTEETKAILSAPPGRAVVSMPGEPNATVVTDLVEGWPSYNDAMQVHLRSITTG